MKQVLISFSGLVFAALQTSTASSLRMQTYLKPELAQTGATQVVTNTACPQGGVPDPSAKQLTIGNQQLLYAYRPDAKIKDAKAYIYDPNAIYDQNTQNYLSNRATGQIVLTDVLRDTQNKIYDFEPNAYIEELKRQEGDQVISDGYAVMTHDPTAYLAGNVICRGVQPPTVIKVDAYTSDQLAAAGYITTGGTAGIVNQDAGAAAGTTVGTAGTTAGVEAGATAGATADATGGATAGTTDPNATQSTDENATLVIVGQPVKHDDGTELILFNPKEQNANIQLVDGQGMSINTYEQTPGAITNTPQTTTDPAATQVTTDPAATQATTDPAAQTIQIGSTGQ